MSGDRDLEARLRSLGEDPDHVARLELSPGVDCLRHSEVAELARSRTPSDAQGRHLATCLRCRTALVSSVLMRACSGHPLLKESAWIRAREETSNWPGFLEGLAERATGPRPSEPRPAPGTWLRFAAAALLLVGGFAAVYFALRSAPAPAFTIDVASTEAQLFNPLRRATEGERFFVGARIEEPVHVRLLALDSEGVLYDLAPDPTRAELMVVLDDPEREYQFGEYPLRITVAADERTILRAIVLASRTALPESPRESAPDRAAGETIEGYAESLAEFWRRRFSCSVAVRACPPIEDE